MDQNIELLDRVLKNNSPLLFLGAGFSIGAKLKTGQNFPKGDDLKHLIIKDLLGLDDSSTAFQELQSYTLSKVCEYAKAERSNDHLNDYIINFFKNGSPALFHNKLLSYKWRKIYTTNVDDIIEGIYKSHNTDLLVQNMGRKSTLIKDNCTEYIKLHGCINNPSEGIVFSVDEYIESMTRSLDYRFSSLTFDINTEDFIFIGSEFEEVNINYYLKLYESSGYKSNRGKLIFINPQPSLFLASQIRKTGAILIKWTAEEFFNHVENFAKINSQISKDTSVITEKSGFKKVNKPIEIQLSSNYDSNIYFGYQPQWEDIFSEWDFSNSDLIDDFERFVNGVERKKTGIYSLYGKAFSGKSVFIRRLAVELINKDFEVYNFSGRFFEYYSFYRQIIQSDSISFCLIVDDASYHYKAIKQLTKFDFKGKQLIVLTSSRPFYHYRKRYHFVEEHYKEYSITPEITENYAENIIAKLAHKGYLGELKRFSSLKEQISAVREKNDIFSFLSFITQGSGFKQRMLKEIVPLVKSNPLVNDLLLKTAIFEELDLPYFPKELITVIYADKAPHLLSQADDFLKFTKSGDIQFRAKFYSNNLINANQKQHILESVQDILISISPQIPVSSSRGSQSYWGEIQESLTKQRLLKSIFKFNNADIKKLLMGIKNYYSENSHLWLQLGIVEQSLGEFEKALNHFRQAEALNSKSYIIQHAIGRNFMKQANSYENRHVAQPYHDEGVSILLPLIENQDEYSARAFSTHSYLYEELNYIEKFQIQVPNSYLKKLFQYLQRIIEKDPNDVMSSHMSNHFYKFLQRTNKLGVINFPLRNLSNFKSLFMDYNTSIEELLHDQDYF